MTRNNLLLTTLLDELNTFHSPYLVAPICLSHTFSSDIRDAPDALGTRTNPQIRTSVAVRILKGGIKAAPVGFDRGTCVSVDDERTTGYRMSEGLGLDRFSIKLPRGRSGRVFQAEYLGIPRCTRCYQADFQTWVCAGDIQPKYNSIGSNVPVPSPQTAQLKHLTVSDSLECLPISLDMCLCLDFAS